MILLPKGNYFSVQLLLDTITWYSSTGHIHKMEDGNGNISYLFGHIRQQVRRWATLSSVIVWVVEGPGLGARGQNQEHYLPHGFMFLLYKHLLIFSQCLQGTSIQNWKNTPANHFFNNSCQYMNPLYWHGASSKSDLSKCECFFSPEPMHSNSCFCVRPLSYKITVIVI